MSRRKRWLVLASVTALVAFVGLLAGLYLTEAGARWVMHRLAGNAVTVERVEGRLAGRVRLLGVSFTAPALTARLDTVTFVWRARGMLRRRLELARLEIGGVGVATQVPEGAPAGEVAATRLALPMLPVDLRVPNARATRVRLERETDTVRVAEVTLAISYSDARWSVDSLHVAGLQVGAATLDASLQGTLGTAAADSVALRLHWAGQLGPAEDRAAIRLAGAGTMRGSLERLEVEHEVEAPVRARVTGRMVNVLEDARWEAGLTVPRFSLRDVGLDADHDVELRLEGSGSLTSLDGAGSITVDEAGMGEWGASLRVAGSGAAWTLDAFDVAGPDSYAGVSGAGQVELGGGPARGRVDLEWTELAWPPSRDWRYRGSAGRLTAVGTADSVAFELESDLASPARGLGRWRVQGFGGQRDGRLRGAWSYLARGPDRTEVSGSGAATYAGGRLVLDSLTIAPGSSPADLVLGGWVEPAAGRPRGRVEARWTALQWPLQGEPSYTSAAGSLTLDGELERFRAVLDADVEGRGLPPGRWAAEGGGALLEGWLQADAAFNGSLAGQPELVGTLRVGVGRGLVMVDTLVVRTPDADGVVSARARVETDAQTPVASVSAQWRNVRWPMAGDAAMESAGGFATLRGDLDGFDVQTELDLVGARVPAGRWRVAGTGTSEGLRLDEIHGTTLDGSVEADAVLRFDSTMTWDLNARGEGLDPGQARPEWPGRLDVDLRASGGTGGPASRTDIAVRYLSGELRGRAFSAAGRLRVEPGGFRFDSLTLASGDTRADVRGGVGDTWDLEWLLDAATLDDLAPGWAGRASLAGVLRGPRAEPTLALRAAGEDFDVMGRRVDSLRADVTVDLASATPSDLRVRLVGLATPRILLDSITLRGHGPASDHRLTFALSGRDERIDGTAAGGWAGGVWDGRLTSLDLASAAAGSWSLEEHTDMTVARDSAALGSGCWVGTSGRLCASGAWSAAGGSSWGLTAARIPMAFLGPALPEGLEVVGEADVRSVGRVDSTRAVIGELTATGGSGAVRYRLDSGAWREQAYDSFAVTAHVDRAGMSADARLVSARAGLTGTMVSPAAASGEVRAVDARLNGELLDRGLLGSLSPSLSETDGSLRVDLRATGPVPEPRIEGSVDLLEGEATIGPLGVRLSDVGVSARSEEDGRWSVSGSAASGRGRLDLDGTVQPARGETPYSVVMDLSGLDFEAYRTEVGWLDVSPQVRVAWRPDALAVDGAVGVPRARITAPRLQFVVPPSPDVVVLGREAAPADATVVPITRARARLRIDLGDDVAIDAFGVTAGLTGGLVVNADPGRPALASGELNLQNAQYRAYRQVFEIERGRLLYASSPLGNPTLDLRIVRQGASVQAGMNVAGPAGEPRVSLFSDPPMSDDQILAHLVIGRPIERMTQSEGTRVQRLAQAIGVAGGQFVVARIGARFGLQDARIDVGRDISDASLVLGRRALPGVHVNYSIGLLGAPNVLGIRYEIGRGWVLQTESGMEAGADLLYTFEGRRPPSTSR